MKWNDIRITQPALDEKVWFRQGKSKTHHAIAVFVGMMPMKGGQRKYRPCFRTDWGFVIDHAPSTEWLSQSDYLIWSEVKE